MSVNRTQGGLGRDVNLKDDQGNGGVRLYATSTTELKLLDPSGNEADLELKDIDVSGTATGITKAMVGLGNCDNTSDANKPVSTAQQTALDLKANLSLKGADNGLAELDGNGTVPAAQLPSYVDDVVEYANLASFPGTGESGKIYVALDTLLTYRWSGSAYVEISQSLALGETSTTAYRGDRGKTAYDHTSLTNNPHSVTKAQVGLGNCDNTSDADKPVSTAGQTALDLKANLATPDFTGQVDLVSGALTIKDNASAGSKVTMNFDTGTGVLSIDKNTHITGNITLSGNVDGRDVAADGVVLDAHKWRSVSFTSSDSATGNIGAELKSGAATFAVKYKVTESWDGSATITIGTASNASLYGTISNDDLQSGQGTIDMVEVFGSDTQVKYTVTGSTSQGGIKLVIPTA